MSIRVRKTNLKNPSILIALTFVKSPIASLIHAIKSAEAIHAHRSKSCDYIRYGKKIMFTERAKKSPIQFMQKIINTQAQAIVGYDDSIIVWCVKMLAHERPKQIPEAWHGSPIAVTKHAPQQRSYQTV